MVVYFIINATIYLISVIIINGGGLGAAIGGIVLNLAAFVMAIVGFSYILHDVTDGKSTKFIKACHASMQEDGDCESVAILRTTVDNSEPEEYEDEEKEEEEGEEE